MLIDGRQLPLGSDIDSTVCIIGSGAAGITLALELARSGHDAVLLEAGGSRRTKRYQATYEGDVDRSDMDGHSMHPPLDQVRVRKLGGTTGAWGGRCAPLDPIDLERRGYVDHSGWPISFDSLGPFYRPANAYCRAGEPDYTVSEALPGADRFIAPNGDSSEIVDRKLLRYSPPTDFGTTYRDRLRRSRIVRVIHHANVLRLELDHSRQRVEHVVAASSPGREFRVRGRVFVIASGGLESARLLLESARRAGSQVGAGHELTGRFYMTHLDGAVGEVRFAERAPEPAYSYEVSRDGVYCRRLLCLTPETQRANRLLNFSTVMHVPAPDDPTHGDGLLSSFALAKDALYRAKLGFKSRRVGLLRSEKLDYRTHLLNVARDPWRLPPFAVDWVSRRSLASRKLPSFLVESRSGAYRFLFSAEQSPSVANRVELGDRWDAFGVPRLRVTWGVRDGDHRSILTTLGIIAANFERLGKGVATVPTSVDQLVEEIGGGFLGGTHAMGTTRMGATPRQGVVDSDCRVHGVGNLYIASSSVFPTSGYAAPTLTIVALSIRLSRTIRTRL